jgi:hypothetical protein
VLALSRGSSAQLRLHPGCRGGVGIRGIRAKGIGEPSPHLRIVAWAGDLAKACNASSILRCSTQALFRPRLPCSRAILRQSPVVPSLSDGGKLVCFRLQNRTSQEPQAQTTVAALGRRFVSSSDCRQMLLPYHAWLMHGARTPSIWARAICPHAPFAAAYERRASMRVAAGAAD